MIERCFLFAAATLRQVARHRRLFFLFLPLTALVLTSCDHAEKRACKKDVPTLRLNYGAPFLTLHPQKVYKQAQIALVKQLGEGFVRFSPTGEPQLGLASHIKPSKNGQVWEFTLRQEARWSDGSAILIDDFLRGWKLVLSGQLKAPSAHLLFVIKNARRVYEGISDLSALGVERIDDQRLRITLEEPMSYFPTLLCEPIFFPLHPSFDEKQPHAVASGPFVLKKLDLKEGMELERNPHYWDHDLEWGDDREYELAQRVVVRFIPSEHSQVGKFKRGFLDFCGTPFLSISDPDLIDFLRSDPGFTKVPEMSTWMLTINSEDSLLQSKELRKALSRALRREEWISSGLFTGSAAKGIVPPSLFSYRGGDFLKENLEEARACLASFCEEAHLKPKDCSLELIYDPANFSKRARRLASHLFATLGIHVRPVAKEEGPLRKNQQEASYQLSSFSWVADYPHPLAFLEIFADRDHPYNFTKWSHPEYTGLVERALGETDHHKQMELVERAQAILLEELPVIPLAHPSSVALTSSRVRKLYFQPGGFVDLRWVSLKRASAKEVAKDTKRSLAAN